MWAICATIAQAETWQEIETFGKISFAHATKRLSNSYEANFRNTRSIVSWDGKALRRNREKLHLVSVWASASGLN